MSLRFAGRHRIAVALALIAVAPLPWGCSDPTPPPAPSPSGVGATHADIGMGHARLAALRARFSSAFPSASVPARLERTDGGDLRVRFAPPGTGAARATAAVELPARARGPVRLRDTASGLSIAFALDGASDTAVAIADGLAIYPTTLSGEGVDVVHVVGPAGTEDFVAFEHEPLRPELRYLVDLGGAAALRLVARTLEFLDEGGAPRLRVTAPYVIDAPGARHDADLSVSGCAVDSDPRPPWGRPLVAPGARACTVTVTWRRASIAYPALVDPRWESTQFLREARTRHAATLLYPGAPASPVLITGGFGEDHAALNTAELYEPLSRTFATTASMSHARGNHTATHLGSTTGGAVLIAGGSVDQDGPPFTVVGPLERYDATSGRFSVVGADAESDRVPRLWHTATRFAEGKVLIAGGTDGTGQSLPDALVYTNDVPGITRTVPLSPGTARAGHTAALLAAEDAPQGDVLLAGGLVASFAQPSGEIFNATSETFERLEDRPDAGLFSSMLLPRAFHTATRLASGEVLLVGGVNAASEPLVWDSAELFIDRGTEMDGARERGFRRQRIAMRARRAHHAATLMPSGGVVVTGGLGALAGSSEPDAELKLADVFSLDTLDFTALPDMPIATTNHTATLVSAGGSANAGGSLLVAGGGTGAKASAFRLLHELGAPCTRGVECESGYCVDGVCCDRACTAECEACSTALKTDSAEANSGRCGNARRGTPTTVTCVDGVKTTSECDGDGNSVPVRSTSCAPFVCDAAGKECSTACRTSAECAPGDGWCSHEPGVVSVPNGCPLNAEVDAAGAGGSAETGGAAGSGGTGSAASSGGAGGVSNPGGSGGVPGSEETGATGGAGGGVGSSGAGGAGGATGAGGAGGVGGEGGAGDAPGTCVCKQPLGAPCKNADECVSNLCVDGHCCNSECGQCEACDVPGLAGFCTTIGTKTSPQVPRSGREPCGGELECQGVCDGTYNDRCYYATVGAPCREPACEDGIAVSYECTEAHACVQAEESPCGAYRCADKVCGTECTSREEHCTTDAVCVGGKCVGISEDTCDGDNLTLVTPRGEEKGCGVYQCKAGAHACANPCNDFTDCVDGFVCNHAGECVPAPSRPEEFSSCSLSNQTGRSERWLWALVILVLSARQSGRSRRGTAASARASAGPML
ncbi:Kelch repeat-containing protein [Sorangium sp. So ce1182]|uniref:Kelch repeat-containing protein n=1 Tax=Sorangium sp. So ce1182 TaxID=3133334 RepID=UPI003F6189EE